MWLFHPLWGDGYQFWSGIGSDLTYLFWPLAFVTWARHHNCHVKGCWRPGHMYHDIGELRCRNHRPQPKE